MTSQRTSGLPPVAAEGAIVVFGATGGVGRHAVEQLLGAGQEVIAVVRDPSKGTALAKAGARVVIHDLQHDDSGRLSRHLTGAESVLLAAGVRYGAPLDELDAVDRGGAVAAVAAAREAGAARFVHVSAIGADIGMYWGWSSGKKPFASGITATAQPSASATSRNAPMAP